jgi:MSHA biogenesis protein MshM
MKTPLPKTNSYRSRFGLNHHPLPRDAAGKTFFDQTKGYKCLEMYFQELLDEPGLGILTAEPGVGKTTAIRNLCANLPEPDYKVIYLCDTAISPSELYRVLALELGINPAFRRAQLWHDLKCGITHLFEEQHILLVLIIDEAQKLSDDFLGDLSGFLNFSFDRKTLLSLWLVGLPALSSRLHMRHHAPLHSRIANQVHLEPLGHDDFIALIEHGLKASGARDKLFTEPAIEMLWRASNGIPRIASKLLRVALQKAHCHNQNIVDNHILQMTIDEIITRLQEKNR